MSNEANAVPLLRRNGQRPSCEPCRKAKYSCDHSKPTCGRCIKRGIVEKCLYHPAPMRGLTTPRPRRSAAAKRSSSVNSGTEAWSQSQSSSFDHNEHSTPIPSLPAPSGFLGSTSYNAVFTEGQHEMGIDPDDGIVETDNLGHIPPPSTQEYEHKIKQGVAVLSLLRNIEHLKTLVQNWMQHRCDAFVWSPWLMACMNSVEKDLKDKGHLRSNETMLAASDMLFRNTAKPIINKKNSKFDDFVKMFTGDSIRWETVGKVFTFCGLCCNDIQPDDPLLDFVQSSQDNKNTLLHKCLDASNTCVDFCDQTRNPNDMGLWLAHENCILMSQVLGDDNYLVWRRVGDLSTAVFASGLHLEGKHYADLPFWLVQLRRRAFASIYNLDKVMCTFVGRPPRISQRYCSAIPPLDLDFEELALEDSELERIMSTLDTNGWNTDGRLRHSTCVIISFLISRVREEILEISLGPSQSDVPEKARDILRRNREIQSSIPEQNRYTSDIWTRRPPDESFLAVTQWLEILYNEFMLQRTLVRRYRGATDDLLRVAQSMMTAILEMSRSPSAHRHFTGCVPWLFASHGLPAAGVLALELLQQHQAPFHTSKTFPRSKVIQDLSVFVSSLGWVLRPGEGNYQLIQQARKMIQKILDRVLTPEPPVHLDRPPFPSPEEEVVYQDPMYDFSWIENAGFDADFWMTLPEHPLLSQESQ